MYNIDSRKVYQIFKDYNILKNIKDDFKSWEDSNAGLILNKINSFYLFHRTLSNKPNIYSTSAYYPIQCIVQQVVRISKLNYEQILEITYSSGVLEKENLYTCETDLSIRPFIDEVLQQIKQEGEAV